MRSFERFKAAQSMPAYSFLLKTGENCSVGHPYSFTKCEFVATGEDFAKIIREGSLLYSPSLVERQFSKVDYDELIRQIGQLVEQKILELIGVPVPASASASALAGARSRGSEYKRAELAKPENAQLKEASVYAGASDRTINKWRNEGSLYALVQEGKLRGYRYPLWQFDADRERLKKALQPFRDANASPWVIHNFFQRAHGSLEGRSPREWVLDPNADIEKLVKIAQQRFAGDQGAS